MTTDGLGPLAAALAKAQSDFGPVKKDKTVTVQKKTGGSYSFSYAPLDTILDAVRAPLAKNGLAMVQLLDTEALVTVLIHDSGASLEARTPVPPTGDIQAYGSAITYLRRYAIQALLGIAAEEDDDGNRGAGNQAAPVHAELLEPTHANGLIGTVEAGKPPVDLQVRQTPDGPAWGFKLKNGRRSYQVLATGDLASVIGVVLGDESLEGVRVEVWGSIDMIPWNKVSQKMPPFPRVNLARLKTPDWELPLSPLREDEPEPIPVAEGQEVLPLDDEERAAVGGVA